MLKETIKFVDFDDKEREETFYFHLTKAELVDLETSIKGGLHAWMTALSKLDKDKLDAGEVLSIYKLLLTKSYGEKSADGRRFDKSPEILRNFTQTEAYSIMYMKLASDINAGLNFIEGVLPKDISAQVAKEKKAILTKISAQTEVSSETRT